MTAETQEERALKQRDALIRSYTRMETLADILVGYVDDPVERSRLKGQFRALKREVCEEMGWKR